jgi:hypothetical protein
MLDMLPLLFVFSPFLVIVLMVLGSGKAPAGVPASPATLFDKIGGEGAVMQLWIFSTARY